MHPQVEHTAAQLTGSSAEPHNDELCAVRVEAQKRTGNVLGTENALVAGEAEATGMKQAPVRQRELQ